MNTQDSLLLSRLTRLGAPLAFDALPESALPDFAETFVRALRLARRNPTVSRVIPVVINKNRDCFSDFSRIRNMADKEGDSDTLGFFLDMTATLSGDTFFSDLASTIPAGRSGVRSFFFNSSGNSRLKKLEELNSPPSARKWGYRMNMSVDSFAGIFGKFARSV